MFFLFSLSSSFEDLESTLQNTKRTYKQTIKTFTYPDGAYVEGWLYIPNEVSESVKI